MFKEEAIIIADILSKMDKKSYSLLNVGSCDLYYRKNIKPYIDELIFSPLKERNIEVLHCDIKASEGVDLIGDFLDPDFIKELTRRKFDCILCNNLLEHIEHPELFCKTMESIVDTSGYIIVTVPYIYPFHPDPIDTGFRPSIEKLGSLFPLCKIVYSQYITISDNHFNTLLRKPKVAFCTLKNWLIPRHGITSWQKGLKDIPNIFKDYKESCVVLCKGKDPFE